MTLPMNRKQHKEITKGAQELSNALFVKFRKSCSRLRKAMPDEAARLQEELTTVFNKKIPEVEKIIFDLRVKKPAEVGEAVRVEGFSHRSSTCCPLTRGSWSCSTTRWRITGRGM